MNNKTTSTTINIKLYPRTINVNSYLTAIPSGSMLANPLASTSVNTYNTYIGPRPYVKNDELLIPISPAIKIKLDRINEKCELVSQQVAAFLAKYETDYNFVRAKKDTVICSYIVAINNIQNVIARINDSSLFYKTDFKEISIAMESVNIYWKELKALIA